MPDGSIVTRELPDGSWYVNGRGEMVRKGHEQDSLQETPLHGQQFPMPPSQETPEQVRLRWKSKWDARTGTARAIGFPAPDSFAGLGYTQSLHKLGFSSPSNTHQHNHYIFGRLTVAGRERI